MSREDLSALKAGDRVCVVGFGTANVVHRHQTVTSVTKLYVNTEWKSKRGDTVKDRHRRDDGRSTPQGDGYGGTTLHSTCQKKEKN
jgi:hypothetical protein